LTAGVTIVDPDSPTSRQSDSADTGAAAVVNVEAELFVRVAEVLEAAVVVLEVDGTAAVENPQPIVKRRW
jgi:hypothetical protein